MATSTAVVASAIFLCMASLTVSGPIHASCTVNWTFGESCSAVKDAIVSQIHRWEGPEGCAKGGEKCLYVLKGQSENGITATHETPKKHYVDDLTFTFSSASNTSCSVKAHSTSETWYAILDSGTNYCNLKNLITGAELDKVKGYKEQTSDDICTQYSSHNCDIY